VSDVLARRDRALDPEETEALLRDRLGEQIVSSTVEFGTFTVHVAPSGWHAAAQLCRDESLLAYDMFDCLFGIDAREEGFDVVVVLYSTSTGNRICLRTRCDGGREAPVCPTLTDIYRGADWMERETYDMFGIDFEGHPGLEPRLLTVENFEGWPLRKDFHLTSRVVKPWPGVKEPAELDDDGNVIERVPGVGDAPGPYDLDKAMAEQARAINQPDEVEVEADPAEIPESAAASGGEDEAAEPPPADIDQETYDRLIAEGKSERIARSKAKAAFIKKQRTAASAAEDPGAAEASVHPEGGCGGR
jgi:NADH:ubiquinone oxidoreductase subunit C